MLEALGVDTSKSLQPDRDRRGADRGDEPSPTRSAVLVRLSPLAHPHRQLPALRLSRREPSTSHACSTIRVAPLHARSLRARTRASGPPPFSRTVLRAASPHRRAAGWRRASCTACSTPTTSTSPARASTTARGASCRTRPGLHRRLFRRHRPLRLRPPARHAAVEPHPAGRMPAALRRRRPALEAALRGFEPKFQSGLTPRMLRRLGLRSARGRSDAALVAPCGSSLASKAHAVRAGLLRLVWRAASEARADGSPAAGALRRRRPSRPVHAALAAHEPGRGRAASTTPISRGKCPARC